MEDFHTQVNVANLRLSRRGLLPKEVNDAEDEASRILLGNICLSDPLPLCKYNTNGTSGTIVAVGTTPETATKWSFESDMLRQSSGLIRNQYYDQEFVFLQKPHEVMFNIYAAWLHTHQLRIYKAPDWADYSQVQLGILMDSYSLGTYMEDPDFRDTVIDAITVFITRRDELGAYCNLPGLQRRHRLYEYTRKDCMARQLLAYHFVRIPKFGEKGDHPGFVGDVVRRRYRNRRIGPLADLPTTLELALECRFHEHAEGECPRQKFCQGKQTLGLNGIARSSSS